MSERHGLFAVTPEEFMQVKKRDNRWLVGYTFMRRLSRGHQAKVISLIEAIQFSMRSLDCLSTARRLPQQIQQRWFNSHHALRLPRHGVQAKEKKGASSRSNRWGNFQRLSPSSLATVNVREWERASVPDNIMKPPYAETGSSSKWQPDIPLNSADDALQLGQACQLAKQILQLGGSMCKPGVTTASIDEALHNAIIRHGAYPSPLNYMGFPKSVCTSVNNVIAHGIPDNRPLENGDIINIDVTVYLNGFHGDTSATFYVGDVDEKGRALVECTRESLDKAIAICGPGVPMKEIGRVICEHAHKHGFSVSDELSGHGIGREFHCLPLVYHHLNHDEGVMQPSMSFTIEPILCEGSAIGIMWPDQWTISTVDGGRSAQFEHTMIVTDDGVDVLTE